MSSTDDTEALLAQRGSIYGDPVPQYGRIAQVWSGLIDHEISAHDAALMMAALKLVRAADTPDHTDSLADAHGYVTIAQRVQAAWDEPVDLTPTEKADTVVARGTWTAREAPAFGPISGKNFPAEPDTGVCRRFGGHVSTTRHASKDCPWVDQ